MYKIDIIKREAGENALTNPLLKCPHMIEKKIMIDDPDGKVDPETGNIIKVEKIEVVEFETDNMTVLEDEVKKIIETIPKSKVRPISDLTFELDILITP